MSGGCGAGTIVGSGFDMPYDMLLRKQEVTCMYESPSMVEDFQRSSLKDMRPLPALFESDQPRGGTDLQGNPYGNNISKRFLSFRDSGFMSEQGAEPYLPDGTFLDHQFLERDPRGIATEPDMRKHVYQQYSRASLINFKNDSDDSVPESGINPWDMNRNVRGTQNVFKNYFKNFSTAKDAWSTAAFRTDFAASKVEQYENSSDMRDPSHLANRNVMNITNTLSNDTSIGFRRTTDHEFKIEKYGKTNIGASFTDEDWYKNRSNSHIDHDVLVSWQDTNVSKAAALKMIDLSKQKLDAHLTGLQGMIWDESKNSRSTKYKLTPSDMAGMKKRQTLDTQPISAHQSLNGDITTSSGQRLITIDAPVINKTKIHSTMVEKLGMINQITTKQQKEDLRNDILQSTIDSNIYMTRANMTPAEMSQDPDKVLWDSIADYEKGNSKAIMNYKAAAKEVKGHNLDKLSEVNFEYDSKNNKQRRGRLDTVSINKKSEGRIDNDFGRDDSVTKLVGALGSKYMTQHMDRDGAVNSINDF
jgi:hypothetical protein